jgi:hypothetical protein
VSAVAVGDGRNNRAVRDADVDEIQFPIFQ